MVRVLAGLALCVGCYSPAVAPGTPCDTQCPGELVCIEHVCREPGYVPGVDAAVVDAFVPIDTVDGPPGDGDADGVTDSIDNCPAAANADQHDEDGDAIGDACDPCPHLSGSAADGDGDGVGDACDPQPDVAKQRIRFFDPFTADLADWSHSSSVGRLGETLRIDVLAGSASTNVNIVNSEVRIATGGTIAAVGSSPRQFSLAVGIDPNGPIYHYGEFYDSGGTEIALTERNGSTYTELGVIDVGGTLPTGAWAMQLDASVAAQTMTVVASVGGTSYAPISGDTSTAPVLTSSPRINMFFRNVDMRLDYFLVIETLP